MQDNTYHINTPKIVGAAAIITIAVIAIVVFVATTGAESANDPDGVDQPANVAVIQNASPTPAVGDDQTSGIDDEEVIEPTEQSVEQPEQESIGVVEVVTAFQSYAVPKGHTNSVSVQLELTDDVVTAATVSHDYIVGSKSGEYIDDFNRGFEETVVGKIIAEIAEENINGASLTSVAFFDSIQGLN